MQSTQSDAQKTIFLLDPIHTGIRIAALFGMALGVLIGFVGFSTIAGLLGFADAQFIIGLLGAVVTMLVFGTLIERYLRLYWPSGRNLAITADDIRLNEKQQAHTVLARTQPIEQTRWYFVVPRRRGTVEKGWLCASLQLQQSDKVIVVYTFLKPSLAEQLPDWATFVQLFSRQAVKTDQQEIETIDPQLALREKESLRWQWGAEMNPEDFKQLLIKLSERG